MKATSTTESILEIIIGDIATNLEMGINQLTAENLQEEQIHKIQLRNGWESLEGELTYVENALKNGYATNYYTGNVNLTSEARAMFQNAQKNIQKIKSAKADYAMLTNGL